MFGYDDLWRDNKENDAHLQISEAFSSGINFIDTAEMYPTCPIKKLVGKEKIIGNWINNNKGKEKILF